MIGDRVGRKRMLIIGMALFGLASLISSYAQTPAELIWARAAMGFGGAAVMPQTLSIITNVFDPEERPKAIGIWASAVGVAIAVGPVTGGVLLEPLLVGLRVLDQRAPDRHRRRRDLHCSCPSPRARHPAGWTTLACCCRSRVWCCSSTGSSGAATRARGWSGVSSAPIAAGLAVLTVFCVHESRTEHPSLDVRLFRDPRLSSAAAAIGLNFFAMSGVYFFMSFYLQDVRGYSPMHAGLLTTPVAIGQLVASNRSASLVGRFGAKAVAASGLAVVTGALIGYHSLTAATPIIGA